MQLYMRQNAALVFIIINVPAFVFAFFLNPKTSSNTGVGWGGVSSLFRQVFKNYVLDKFVIV